MNKTKIEWTDMSWNPCTGCSKISSGCTNCYAEPAAEHEKRMGVVKYKNGFQLTPHQYTLTQPYHWRKPRKVFVNSMSDLFHENLKFPFIQEVFKVMNENPQHIFQVLTKRADILQKDAPFLTWSDNIWMGVTVESDQYYSRINALKTTGAKVKFLSCEPLLSSIRSMPLVGIDWVIVGGESGAKAKARPIQDDWVREVRDNCLTANIPFFFKQYGGVRKKQSVLDGVEHKEFPK
jgi:protein gp37